MSALDSITPVVVYRWPDGWYVTICVGSLRRVRGIHGVPVFPVEMTLRGSRYDDRWAVVHLGGDAVFEWSGSSTGWQLPEVPRGEARKKLLGFLLDLEVGRPQIGIRASLVTQVPKPHLGGNQLEVHAPSVPYPRWVDDVRWEQRYEEAHRFVLRPLGDPSESTWQMDASMQELYLSYLKELELRSPGFYQDDLWRATCIGQSSCTVSTESGHPESLYFHAVVDQLLDSELLLPASSKRAWEAEHVLFGEWVLPGPEEVEIYKMIGEQLPLLWGAERLRRWLQERP